MSCDCISEQENSADFMAKTSSSLEGGSVLAKLGEALALLDTEQESIDENTDLFVHYRQSREKLKALIKFIDARLYK